MTFVNYRTEIQKNNHHFAFADTTKDAIHICEELNELSKENQEYKDFVGNTVLEVFNTEKTTMGKKVIQNLAFALGIEIVDE